MCLLELDKTKVIEKDYLLNNKKHNSKNNVRLSVRYDYVAAACQSIFVPFRINFTNYLYIIIYISSIQKLHQVSPCQLCANKVLLISLMCISPILGMPSTAVLYFGAARECLSEK